MPIINQSDATALRTDERVKRQKEQTQEVSTLDALEAAGAMYNSIGSLVAFGLQDQEVKNRDYDPINRIKEMGRPDLMSAAVYADSDDELNRIIEQDAREKRYKDILDNSGFVGFASTMAAGLLDPTILIPGTGHLKAGSAMYRMAKGTGSGAALGAAALGAQSSVLAATQLDKSAEDAVFDAVGGMIFGGIFGAASARMSSGSKSQAQSIIDDIRADTDMQVEIKAPSVGAAGVSLETKAAGFQFKKNQEGIANLNENLTKVLAGGPRVLRSPIINGLTSRFATVREYTNDIFSHNFIINKNLRGRETGSAVEAEMKIDKATIIRTNAKLNKLYLEAAGESGKSFAAVRAAVGGARGKNMTWGDFSEEVAKALRRGDTHEIPQVQKAAQMIRSDMDKMTKELQELGILADDLDVKTAQSWLSRRYNQEKIAVDRTGANRFRSIIANKFAKDAGLAPDNPEILDRAEETIRRIQGLGDESLQMSDLSQHMTTKGGKFTKERVLDIRDEELEEFLVNDGIGLYSSYMLQASAMAQLQKKMASKGFESIQDIREELVRESDTLVADLAKKREAALKGKSGKEAAEINKQFDKEASAIGKETKEAIEDLNNNTKLILGQFGETGKFDSKLRLLRKYQTMRLLGGVVISSIPDIAMPIFRHGLGNTLEFGYKPMMKNFAASKASRDDLKHINIGLELESNEILRSITDPDFKLGQTRSEIERVADVANEAFGKVTGISYWNNFHRRLAGQISLGRHLALFKKFDKTGVLDEADKVRLASLGLNEDDVKAIWKEFKAHGIEDSGSFIANLSNWNRDISRKFGQAILKDADSTILVPGAGDIPLIAQNSEVAKTIFQFKSFLFAATNKILLSGLQRRDKATVAGLAALIVMGGMSTHYKDIIANREPSDSYTEFLTNGISNSGVTGLLGEAASALNPWYKSTRYAGITAESFLLGPSANLVSDGQSAIAGIIGDTELKDSDLRRMGRMLPFQNLFYIRALMNNVGDNQK